LTSDNKILSLLKSSPSIDQSRELHEDQEVKENEKDMRNIFASKKVPQLPKVISSLMYEVFMCTLDVYTNNCPGKRTCQK
jgi:hypothetical protein